MNFCVLEYTSSIQLNNPNVEIWAANGRMACSLWRQTEAQQSYPGEPRMQEPRQPKDSRIKLHSNRPNVKVTECISSWQARQVSILTSLLPNPELGGFDKWLIILRQVPLSDGARGKEPICQCGRCQRHRFNPRVRKIPRRRKWKATPVFLPGKPHEERSPVSYGP